MASIWFSNFLLFFHHVLQFSNTGGGLRHFIRILLRTERFWLLASDGFDSCHEICIWNCRIKFISRVYKLTLYKYLPKINPIINTKYIQYRLPIFWGIRIAKIIMLNMNAPPHPKENIHLKYGTEAWGSFERLGIYLCTNIMAMPTNIFSTRLIVPYTNPLLSMKKNSKKNYIWARGIFLGNILLIFEIFQKVKSPMSGPTRFAIIDMEQVWWVELLAPKSTAIPIISYVIVALFWHPIHIHKQATWEWTIIY